MHAMDYFDAAMTGTVSPHVLPIMDLKKILMHIEETLLPTLDLPVSSEDTLHFYRCTAITTAITVICSGETSKFITVLKPVHILQLPPVCSTTTPKFHLPPHYEKHL